MKKQKFIKLGIILLIAIVVSTSTYAFAAANTVPTSKAGAGSGAISGYAVSNVHYNLNTTNPSTIDSITFTLDSAPKAGSTIKIKLVSAGSTWYACTNVSTAVTCSSLSVSVVSVNTLEVVIAD